MDVVYGSYEQVAILGSMDDHFLTAVGYLKDDVDVLTKSVFIYIIGFTNKWHFWVPCTTIVDFKFFNTFILGQTSLGKKI